MSNTEELKGRFKNVEQQLLKKPWFKKEKWIVSVHAFPNDNNPDGVTFQVYKEHWFNDDHQGIHIESYLDLDNKKQKKTYVTLHLLHSALIPGTKLKRDALSKPFIDVIYEQVSKWPGYKFRAGKYGTQPFTKLFDATSVEFEKDLEVEVTRICTQLSPILEDCLAELL